MGKYVLHYRSNLRLAVPVMISQLGHTLVQAADSVIVGQFAGTVPLAAVSLVNSLFTIIMVIGIGISYGLTPLVAQQHGRANASECGKLLSNSLWINIIAGLALFVALYFGMTVLMGKLHQSPEVLRQALPYLALLSFSIIPLMIFNTFKQFAEGLGFTRQAMMISIWGNVLNIVLGVIFVKGMFGIRPMGVSGVGWSTLIDRTLMAAVMGGYVLRSAHFRPYLKNFVLRRLGWARAKRILHIGTPVALQYAFEVSAFSGAAILMGTLGAVQQAAHQVAISMAAMTYMMASGISAAAAIKSGNHYGRKDFGELRVSALSSYHIVLVFMSITAAVLIIFHRSLPWLYTSDQAVIAIAAQLLIIAGFFQLFDGAQVVGLGILRGMGDVKIPAAITFLAYWVIGIPVGYLLGIVANWGAQGIWYGLTLGLLASAVLLLIRFRQLSKQLVNDSR